MQLSSNKILITGGASGIGLGLTERFIKEGNTVIICGRRLTELEMVQDRYPEVIIRQCDLELESERIALYEWVREEHSDLNVLINNAGIQQWMKVTDDNFYERAKQEVGINVLAPLHLVTLFTKLPSLQTVMNVTSALSYVPLLKVPVYCATKAFMHSFTTSLRALLEQQNIEVIEIIPPALNTDLGGKGLHDAFPPVADFIETIFNQLKEGKTRLTFGMSETIVNAGPEVLEQVFNRMNAN